MRGQQDRTSVRILSLALNLLNTRAGYSRARIRDLMSDYASMSDSTFQRTFERDIAALRESGLDVTVSSGGDPSYQIRNHSRVGQPVELTDTELRILSHAASAWDSGVPAELSRLSLKLNAKLASGQRGAATPKVEGRLEGTEHLRSILSAMGLRQPISFRYAARNGRSEQRDVAALSLVVRGRAVYLWGYDFNREAERHFRLSRITSSIEMVGEPDCYELPTELPGTLGDHSWRFDVSPLLWVRRGGAALVRLRTGEHVDPASYGLDRVSGWDLVVGNAGDWASWERLVVESAPECVVAAPAHLRTRIRSLLEMAAREEGRSDGR